MKRPEALARIQSVGATDVVDGTTEDGYPCIHFVVNDWACRAVFADYSRAGSQACKHVSTWDHYRGNREGWAKTDSFSWFRRDVDAADINEAIVRGEQP